MGAASHSHIQIIPRVEGEIADDHDCNEGGIPTFRSPSLQFPSSLNQESRRGSAVSDSSTSGTTFADMARRISKRDLEGTEKPTSGPLPLVGMIKLQPGRNRKGNKSWRPLQPSDLGGDESVGSFDIDDSSSPADISDTQNPFMLQSTRAVHSKASPNQPPLIPTSIPSQAGLELQESIDISGLRGESQCAFLDDRSENISPADIRGCIVEKYTRLFGELPDLIRLHEKLGDFDGQVMFVFPPNRDVVAHQWSARSFQWVSIGTWSHARLKIEGPIASDRIPSTGFAVDTLEYFKCIAENREKIVKQFRRPRDTLTEAGRAPSLPTVSGSPNETFPRHQRSIDTRESRELSSSVQSASRNITREQLEDPFVTPAKPQPGQSTIPASFKLRGSCSGNIGSMDLGYEFPVKPAAATASVAYQRATQKAYTHRALEHMEMDSGEGGHLRECGTSTNLREVDFGEEASSAFAVPVPKLPRNRMQVPLSPEDIRRRQSIKNNLTELGEQARRPSFIVPDRVAVPNLVALNTNIRALFPPGPTVANPYQGVSTLNAKAPPYRMPNASQASGGSGSESTAVNAPFARNLQFSDPDGALVSHTCEIANGLGQQAPTRQNFNGPFFCESIPTPSDPTASFTVQIGDDEKLAKWFHDGERVHRQKEYAKSLIRAAQASHRVRNVGAVGDGSYGFRGLTNYENTIRFVRVYENLFEYAEESRSGGNRSYFTRAWKPAPLHLRDLSPEGNNSFFSEAPRTSSQALQNENWLFPPIHSSTGGGIGLPGGIGAANFGHNFTLNG